ncbi:DUF481 domain-containing protein [Rubellimicrobium roseum]|uniref:DUF481 domain-containing protein n=1 Tax=Rubellimicrobium roseum TaxID=687525 RepID=A0A5C4NEM8_9RHOB|nr:DUF481 domain-containing protein [Rubellimicrobium roseum]TNC72390.1 DUF481 domain-containing protein [Rubellimicrobium roseum]
MNDIRLWASVAAAALLASAAQAQSTVFGIEDAAIDVVDEIQEDVEDDFDRDLDVVGNVGRELGYSGSIAGRLTALSGNNDDLNAGIGARYGFYDGVNGGEINFAFTYTDDGEDEQETSFYLSTEYTRDFSDRFYAYAQGVGAFDDNPGEFDELEDDELSGQREDIFVGVGLGYRIIETERLAWGVQAGPGYRWYEGFDNLTTPEDEGDRVKEVAASLSSDLIYQFTDTVALSNDTDVIASDDNTAVTNDLALVVGISEALQLRTSLLTEYNSDPAPGLKDTDNTLGVAVVYNF